MKSLLEKNYNKELVKEILNNLKQRNTTFRINYKKITNKEIEEYLNLNKVSYSKIPFYIDVYMIKSDFDITNTSIYKEGKIYLQSLASMLPAFFIEEVKDILDMCSAPGGKATLIQSIYNDKTILATELNYKRYMRLKSNIEKQETKGITIKNINSLDLDEYLKFDCILLDAPCSGSATVTTTFNYNQKDIIAFSQKQLKLLEKADKLLKPNGTILYSTCSILKEENEEVVLKFLKNKKYEIVKIKEEYLEQIPSKIGITIKPNELTEGFYLIKLKKLNS